MRCSSSLSCCWRRVGDLQLRKIEHTLYEGSSFLITRANGLVTEKPTHIVTHSTIGGTMPLPGHTQAESTRETVPTLVQSCGSYRVRMPSKCREPNVCALRELSGSVSHLHGLIIEWCGSLGHQTHLKLHLLILNSFHTTTHQTRMGACLCPG